MEDKLKDFLSSCSEIDFGAVNLSNGEKEFRRELNNEVISLCKSLPESTQTDALLFFMRYFRIPFGQELSIFSNYYVPAWSIIYWLIQSATEGKELEQRYKQNAKIAHSMALFLHPLDDHLNDGQLQATHLTLLLRSQSWMIMNKALISLAEEVDGGGEIVEGFLGNYYSSIKSSQEFVSLDIYCDHFRKQMATWLIVPVLVTKKMTTNDQFIDAIQTAYESFGIAWRLLDDINDIQIDMMKGAHSSIYACLPEDIKSHWDDGTEDTKKSYSKDILNYILENSVISSVRERICSELESAASIADGHDLTGLAHEFRCLLDPLKNDWKDL